MKNTFIPKNQNKTVISIRINNTMIKQIEELAAESNVSRNELIRQLLEFSLERTSENKKMK
jgi:metal-responsive CopG/Arc/MetJ family transcriptional regulator